MYELSKPRHEIDWTFVLNIIQHKISSAIFLPHHHQELIHGRAGYLYSFLLIEQKLKDKELEEDGHDRFKFIRNVLYSKIIWCV